MEGTPKTRVPFCITRLKLNEGPLKVGVLIYRYILLRSNPNRLQSEVVFIAGESGEEESLENTEK